MSPLLDSPPTEKSERKRTDTRSVGPSPEGAPSGGYPKGRPPLVRRATVASCARSATWAWMAWLNCRDFFQRAVALELSFFEAAYPDRT